MRPFPARGWVAPTSLARVIRPHLERLLNSARAHLPHRLLPLVVALRFRLAWSRESVRADARRQMAHLLSAKRPDADLEAAARAYVRRMIWRGELRWHPEILTRRPLDGIEHLLRAQEDGRGVMVVYTHHGNFDGAPGAISRHGVKLWMTTFPRTLADDAPSWLKQHVVASCWGGSEAVSTAIGTQGIVDLLQQGEVVTLACDVAGRTPVHVLGRDLTGSFGAARVPFLADSPVVLMTTEKDARGHEFVRLHEPLEPSDFDSPQELLEVILARHEEVLLTWPELHDVPLSRWGERSPDDITA